jgi:hypothetical protein
MEEHEILDPDFEDLEWYDDIENEEPVEDFDEDFY